MRTTVPQFVRDRHVRLQGEALRRIIPKAVRAKWPADWVAVGRMGRIEVYRNLEEYRDVKWRRLARTPLAVFHYNEEDYHAQTQIGRETADR